MRRARFSRGIPEVSRGNQANLDRPSDPSARRRVKGVPARVVAKLPRAAAPAAWRERLLAKEARRRHFLIRFVSVAMESSVLLEMRAPLIHRYTVLGATPRASASASCQRTPGGRPQMGQAWPNSRFPIFSSSRGVIVVTPPTFSRSDCVVSALSRCARSFRSDARQIGEAGGLRHLGDELARPHFAVGQILIRAVKRTEIVEGESPLDDPIRQRARERPHDRVLQLVDLIAKTPGLLDGARTTIARCRPLLFIEYQKVDPQALSSRLLEAGYFLLAVDFNFCAFL